MFVLYNILQPLFALFFLPVLMLLVVCRSKYRKRVPSRLGIGLAKSIPPNQQNSGPTFWLHALSVGEVTSAAPLIAGIRAKYPKSRIVFSVTTLTGHQVAQNLLDKTVDCLIAGPLDFLPTVNIFINTIRPDLFILVETDFWPNLLLLLKARNVPTLLVNGRISDQSYTRYRRLRFFFQPMFQSFTTLIMQTRNDREKMVTFGVAGEKLPTLGNLKYATSITKTTEITDRKELSLPENRMILIGGSTHHPEEQILIDCFCHFRIAYPDLFLVIAPRDPQRAPEITTIARERGLTTGLRSAENGPFVDLYILDTLGELLDYYALADIAFVGGSLVNKGGHNPIEPATVGVPVLFGPNMQDFSEIAESLLAAGGAVMVRDSAELTKTLTAMLQNRGYREAMGQAARHCVLQQRDIITQYLEQIQILL